MSEHGGPDLTISPYAIGLARATAGKLFFLHVEAPGEQEVAVRRLLDQLESTARKWKIETQVIRRTGRVVAVIREVAEHLPADVVLLTRHRRSHLFEGIWRTLENDAGPYHVPCPVLVVTGQVQERGRRGNVSSVLPLRAPDPSSWHAGSH